MLILNLLWILVNFGIANTVVNSSLSYSIWQKIGRPPPKVLSCVMCLSFWTPIPLIMTWHSPTGFFLWDMFLGSATSWLIFLLIADKQSRY